MLSAATLIAAIQASAALASTLTQLVETAETVMTSNDAAAVQAELTQLQAQNDALNTAVQAKLTAAAAA